MVQKATKARTAPDKEFVAIKRIERIMADLDYTAQDRIWEFIQGRRIAKMWKEAAPRPMGELLEEEAQALRGEAKMPAAERAFGPTRGGA